MHFELTRRGSLAGACKTDARVACLLPIPCFSVYFAYRPIGQVSLGTETRRAVKLGFRRGVLLLFARGRSNTLTHILTPHLPPAARDPLPIHQSRPYSSSIGPASKYAGTRCSRNGRTRNNPGDGSNLVPVSHSCSAPPAFRLPCPHHQIVSREGWPLAGLSLRLYPSCITQSSAFLYLCARRAPRVRWEICNPGCERRTQSGCKNG